MMAMGYHVCGTRSTQGRLAPVRHLQRGRQCKDTGQHRWCQQHRDIAHCPLSGALTQHQRLASTRWRSGVGTAPTGTATWQQAARGTAGGQITETMAVVMLVSIARLGGRLCTQQRGERWGDGCNH
jgi:hypothetical protein